MEEHLEVKARAIEGMPDGDSLYVGKLEAEWDSVLRDRAWDRSLRATARSDSPFGPVAQVVRAHA